MSSDDRPGGAAGLPVLFPAWLDRFQIKYMNPVVRHAAPFLPTFAVVKHRGRKSGKNYETVVNAYRKGDKIAILLGHGKTDWAKNVLAAGEADIHLFRRDVHITNPQILPAGTDADWLPWTVKQGARRMGVFVADIA